MSPIGSHIDEKRFINFLQELKTGNDRSWYQLDFVLKRIICKWLIQKGIPVEDSLEIYNTIFSIFYEKIQRVEFESFRNLKSYVFAIADNKVKEFYRSRMNRRRRESLDNVPYSKYISALAAAQQGNNPGQNNNPEKIKRIENCYFLLTKKERSVIDLVYGDGKSMKEAAKILAMGEGNVRVIKHRALEKIKKAIFEGDG